MDKSKLGVLPSRPRICVVSTTPLNISTFLQPHLRRCAEFADVCVALNLKNDPLTPALNLPVMIKQIAIKRPIAPIYDLFALIQLWSFFRRERFDLVWAVAPKAGLAGMIAAWLARVPVRLFIFQGEVWSSKRGLVRHLLKLADKTTAALATHVLAVSASERLFLAEQGIVAAERVTVLANGSICGVNLQRFTPDLSARALVRAELGIPADACVAVFIGRYTRDKGVYDLVEAFRSIYEIASDLWLLMVGPDEEDAEAGLQQSLGEAMSRCRFVGYTVVPERYMAAGDFICLPSYREGFGLVVIEAGAVGLPAIASRVHGLTDALEENKTGLMHAAGDVGDIAACMLRLAQDIALRESMAVNARARAARQFGSEHVVDAYADYLKRRLDELQ